MIGASAVAVLPALAPLGSPLATAASPPVPPTCRPAPAPVAFSNSTDVSIPDGGAATSTITVAGLHQLTAFDVDVRTNIRHPSPGELEIELVSPIGQRVMLSSRNGGVAADAFNGTLWDDSADPDGQVPSTANANLATDHPYMAGVVASPLAPEEGLSGLRSAANGVWSLVVTDRSSGNVGTIEDWSLLITTQSSTSFPTPKVRTEITNSVAVPIGSGPPDSVSSAIVVPPIDANYLDSVPRMTTNISHERSDDLDVTLRSPAGTVVTLTTDNGDGAADVFAGTVWDDAAGTADVRVTDLSFLGGAVPRLAPEEPMGAFLGENPVGTWILTVSDDTPLEGGAITSWTLSLVSSGCAPDLPLTVRQTPQTARAGRPLTLDATVTVGPAITGEDVTITAMVPPTMRFRGLTPSAGGACTAPKVGASGNVSCTWVGAAPVGSIRGFRLVVTPFVARLVSVSFGVSNGITPGLGTNPSPFGVRVEPSSLPALNGRRCTIVGTAGPDTLSAFPLGGGSAVICGLGGRDRITGAGRADVLDGGPGDDIISAKGGDDVIFGGLGRDRISGGSGHDVLHGGAGSDALLGGPGRDTVVRPIGDMKVGIERVR